VRQTPKLTRLGPEPTMRILGPNATVRATAPSTAKRPASGGFSLDQSDATQGGQPVAALRTIGGIDALLALQGQDDKAERRRRAVTRGRSALDALDELKTELLAGNLGPSTLQRLKSATADLLDASGDERLDGVMAEIDLRLAVEIAKLTPR
jgi:hypothetical protein